MGDGGGGQGQYFIININGILILWVMLVRVSVVFAFISLHFTANLLVSFPIIICISFYWEKEWDESEWVNE
jgi:hypothetical protein